MKTASSPMTHSHVNQLMRLAWLVSALCILIGVLWLFIPMPKQPTPGNIIQATVREHISTALLFASYSELTSSRKSPFKFQELTVAQVQTREPESTVASTLPQPAAAVLPDTTGLLLVGTAPGGVGAFAMLQDQRSGFTTTISLNDQVRNATVEEIHPDKIVLVLDDQRAEILLSAIAGSEDLSRQLQGLPPLERQSGETQESDAQAQSATAAPPEPAQSVQNAILTGTVSQGSVVVVQSTEAILPVNTTEQSNAVQAQPVVNNSTAQVAQPSQATAPENKPATSANQRSLGISGHMLGLKQQEKLGLQQTGLLVTSVRNDNSTIHVDDVLLSIGGKNFTNLAEAKDIINQLPGDSAQLQILRNGSTIDVTANLI